MMPVKEGRRRSRLLGLILRSAAAMGLLGIAIRMNRQEIQGVIAHRPDPLGFARGMAFYVAGILLAQVRWYMLVRASGLAFRLVDAMRLGWIGAFFNFVIPGAVFGNVIKAAFLAREKPEDKPRAILTVLIDFLCGLIGLFLIAAIAGTLGRDQLPKPTHKLVVTTWVAVAVTAARDPLGLTPEAFSAQSSRGVRLSRPFRRRRRRDRHGHGHARAERPGVFVRERGPLRSPRPVPGRASPDRAPRPLHDGRPAPVRGPGHL